MNDEEQWVYFDEDGVEGLWDIDGRPYPAAEDWLNRRAAEIVHERIAEKCKQD